MFKLKEPIVYITRDLERALGLPLGTKNYYIISNYSRFANSLAKEHHNILLIKGKGILDTRELLVHSKTKRFVGSLQKAKILVFKNTSLIEKICAEAGFYLLNPSAQLASMIEEKISQVKWLGELQKYLPPHEIKNAKEIVWTGQRFILQFNRAHTGSGTILIENEKQLQEIKKKFPNRPVRVTKYIEGVMLTNNNIVWGKKVLCGNINVQITGLSPFTTRPFATVGNDWAYPHKILNKKQKKEYEKICQAVGKKLANDEWRGLFGVDILLDRASGKLFLIEINARQPASTTFESQLQSKKSKYGFTTFQAHLSALLEEKKEISKLISINNGAQITQKVLLNKFKLSSSQLASFSAKLKKNKFRFFFYENSEPESDWIRIQSFGGLLKDENSLNQNGQKLNKLILSII